MKINRLTLIIILLIFTGCGLHWWSGDPETYEFKGIDLYITMQRLENCKYKFYFHDEPDNPGTDYIVLSECPSDVLTNSFSFLPSKPHEIVILQAISAIRNVDSIVSNRYKILTSPFIDLDYEMELNYNSVITEKQIKYLERLKSWNDSIEQRTSNVSIYPNDYFKGFSYWINGKYEDQAVLVSNKL